MARKPNPERPATHSERLDEAARTALAHLAAADQAREHAADTGTPAPATALPAAPGPHGPDTGAERVPATPHGHGLAPLDPFATVREPLKRAFLRAYAITGRKTRAAELAGIHPSTPRTAQWRDDPEFREGLEIAEQIAADLLEDEAVRRAKDGVVRYQFTKDGDPLVHPVTGEPYYEVSYSDTLLIFLMKGMNREKYGDKLALRGSIASLDLSRLNDEQLDRVTRGEHPLQVLAEALEGKALPPGREVGDG